MIIREIIWINTFLEKIQTKHRLEPGEIEYVLQHRPHIRYVERGNVKDEDLYQAWGRTSAGRYVIVYFLLKEPADALPISARDMTAKEKRFYASQKKGQA
jgi:uncharacterized DUF497 family protein